MHRVVIGAICGILFGIAECAHGRLRKDSLHWEHHFSGISSADLQLVYSLQTSHSEFILWYPVQLLVY
jgi:hypothetical protein